MTEVVQDGAVRHPRGRLGMALVLLRALAGHRGYAEAVWAGQGFTYTLQAVRTPDTPPGLIHVDHDDFDDGLFDDTDPELLIGDFRELLEDEP